MRDAHTFRHLLTHRILALIALSIPAGSAAGCLFSTSCPDDAKAFSKTACFAWPPADGAGGGGGGSGGGGSGGGAESVPCPSRKKADEELARLGFSSHTTTSDGTRKGEECCYEANVVPICEGRPYLVEDVARTALPLKTGDGPGWGASGAIAPRVEGIDADLRGILAAEWTRDALFEHASVASFGRFALELLAVGAPAALVEAAHLAAIDEVHHARLCFALAGAYAGEAFAPGAFPFEGRVDVVSDLASIAARTAKEGCIGETIAASIAAEQLADAEDPGVVSALEIIAADEARHAELAWRVVTWAVQVGGAPVREAVEAVFRRMDGPAAVALGGVEDSRLRAHGRLGSKALGEAATRALDDIVRPAARALLSAPGHRSLRRSVSATTPRATRRARSAGA